MKETTITTIEQFNILPDRFDETTHIYLNCYLGVFNKSIVNGYFYVTGGTINDVSGGTINDVSGGTINDVSGGTISYVRGGTINHVSGGTINDVRGGTINDVSGGTINDVRGGTINDVRGTAGIHFHDETKTLLISGLAVCWIYGKARAIAESKTATIIEVKYKDALEEYEMNNSIDLSKDTVILYKKVSSDFKTQEGAKNETLWKIGEYVEHPNWLPDKQECGEGKFHACSQPIFCNQFRSNEGDKYIAIEVLKEGLHAWPNPQYPRKIAFRKCKVLHECNQAGEKI